MTTLKHPIPVGKPRLFIGIFFLMLVALSTRAQNSADGNDLFAQIESLQNQMHIEIVGLERIQNEPRTTTRGNLDQQLAQLLAPYNHIISRTTQGRIERVVIINKKEKRETSRIILPTRSEGKHLMVSVSLSGDGRVWQTLEMMIDTGADLVVLPESMIAQLGLANSKFSRQTMQTANGTAEAQIGLLKEVKIAGETVENVEAAFVADKLLAGNSLLGMSVLGRYQINIDDASQSITLFKK